MAKKLLHYSGDQECLAKKCLLVISHHFTGLDAYAFFTDLPTEQLSMTNNYHAGWSTSIGPKLLTKVLPKKNTQLTGRGWVERVRGKKTEQSLPMTAAKSDDKKRHHQNLEQKIVEAFVMIMADEYGYEATLIKPGNGFYCFQLKSLEQTQKPAD